MTKVIVLGKNNPNEEVKKIEFTKALNTDFDFMDAMDFPNNWNYVELICKNYEVGIDLMFAYDDDRNKGCLYIGQFNDGVV